MKKILLFALIILVLSGCAKKQIYVYSDDEINDFDKILENTGNGKTKAYDLRSEEKCFEGRIPKFFCMRTKNSLGEEISLDQIYENMKILLNDNYKTLIIFIDDGNNEASYLAEKLFRDGFYNIHYFKNGYERYRELKGESFIPETGDCGVC